MNRMIILLFLLMITAPVMAQKITGKWKPVKMYMPELGEIPIEPEPLRDFLYEKMIERKLDGELTARDSIEIEKQVIEMQQIGKATIEFKADKTYISYLDGEKRTGTYRYNAIKKILISYPKGKPSNTVNITFDKGLMKLQEPGDDMIMYMKKM